MIEDSVQAAVSAGMRVFGFAGGSHCRPRLRGRLLDAGAECVLEDFRKLPELVPAAF